MKPILTLIFLMFITSCEKNSTNRNPYLQEINFRFDANLNLPLYSPLTNTGSTVLITTDGIGTKGIFIINSGFNQYRAFEASCPNHAANNCSTMTLNGQIATCSCEGYEYSLFTGQQLNRPDDGNRYYDMLEYRATFSGSTVVVTN
ncbi:Rieske (2Fe-2S) protein [Maribacter sp. CXY002]|uniref:Rieske (2Fe-2S) protein n=1 Tax=Maribacter luteocoastalis TaxID=3407671 RepID=UPI003B6771E8